MRRMWQFLAEDKVILVLGYNQTTLRRTETRLKMDVNPNLDKQINPEEENDINNTKGPLPVPVNVSILRWSNYQLGR